MSYLSSRRVLKRAKSFTGIALTLLMVFQALGPGVFALKTAHAASTVFSDGFENTPPFSNPAWDQADNKWQSNTSSKRTGSRGAQVEGNTGVQDDVLRKNQSTIGYKNITLDYWFNIENNLENSGGDKVEVQWSSNGSTWTTLFTITQSNNGGGWIHKTHVLPASANNNANLAFRFKAHLDSGNDKVYLDDVSLIGDQEQPKLTLNFSCTIKDGGAIWFVKNSYGSDIDFDWKVLPNGATGSETAVYTNNYVAPWGDTSLQVPEQGNLEITWQQGGIDFSAQKEIDVNDICKGTLTVVKEVVGGDAKVGDFQLYVNGNSVTSGQEVEVNAESPNVHTITEDNLPNYTASFSSNCPDGKITVGFEEEATCTVTNTYEAPQVDEAELVVSKVMCKTEADLPDWGTTPGGADITANTAIDFVNNSQGNCWFEEGWDFEWAPFGTPDAGGSTIGPAGGAWTTFGSTDANGVATITVDTDSLNEDKIWVREVLQSGYINFSGPENGLQDDVSAEMYCHTDVLNFDNYDRVDGIANGNTYYCVAINVPETLPAQCEPGVELIKNGSFEAPVVTDLAQWDVFDSGTPGLEWVVDWMRIGGSEPSPASLELHRGVLGVAANGEQYAELDGDWGGPGHGGNEDASTLIYQDIPTVPGEKYTLKFSFKPRPDASSNSQNTLGILWEGADEAVLNADDTLGDWTEFTYELTAGLSGLSRLQFEDRGTGDSLGTFLDNVSLMCEEEKCEETSGSIVSNTTDIAVNDGVDSLAELVNPIHSAWTASIPGASWVWSENPIADAVAETNREFSHSFVVPGTPAAGSLDIAADNSYEVWLNGEKVAESSEENNHALETQDAYVIPADKFINGNNTIVFKVKNWAQAGGTMATNPAGLMYKLTWNTTCENGGGDPDPEEARVTIAKYVDGELATTQVVGDEDFVIDYSISGLNGNSAGQTILTGDSPTASFNAFIGDTVNVTEFTSDHDKQYDEVPLGGQCSNGLYRLAGYSFGSNQTEAENASIDYDTSFANGGLVGNLYVIVHNETCPELSTVTMCKLDAGSQDAPLSGWQLLLLGDQVESGLVVDSTSQTGSDTTASLVAGASYVARAEGTWSNQNGANLVDAEYSTADGWSSFMDGYIGYSTEILELQLAANPLFGDWGAYNENHVYWQGFSPSVDGSYNFRIFDGDANTNTQNPGWFGDNSGSLTVDVYEGFTGVTEDNGCVIFNNVPFGEYDADEVLQDGWELVDGTGSVIVDEAEETFNIRNTRDSGDNGGGGNTVDPYIVKEVNDPNPDQGDTIVYTITVYNNSNAPITNLLVEDTLPVQVTYVSDNGTDATNVIGNTITWTIISIPANGSVSIDVEVTVNQGVSGNIPNTATITDAGDQGNSDTNNDSDSATISVNVGGGGSGGRVAGASTFSSGGGSGDPEIAGAAIDLPGLPNTGNGENSQFAVTVLALIVSLLALNYFGLKALKRG